APDDFGAAAWLCKEVHEYRFQAKNQAGTSKPGLFPAKNGERAGNLLRGREALARTSGMKIRGRMYERFTKQFRVEIRTPSSCQCYPSMTQPVFEIHLPLF
ncbi:hypothetical protein, partial [Salmonella enterica]|uniref:hypothetical protein n=1 Tax=Salmonella enterica TaxID=28901 RepID=UPI0022386915